MQVAISYAHFHFYCTTLNETYGRTDVTLVAYKRDVIVCRAKKHSSVKLTVERDAVLDINTDNAVVNKNEIWDLGNGLDVARLRNVRRRERGRRGRGA